MKHIIAFDKCKSYIDSQLQAKASGVPIVTHLQRGPAVTISRQTGAGADVVAEKLAAYLQKHETEAPFSWTVFNKDLVEKVLELHNLPKRLAQYMPEKRLSYVQDTLEEILSVRPSSWTLVHKTMEAILHLAEMGHAILVGRGANVITAKLPNVFHVRLVGSLEKRVAHAQQYYKLGPKKALDFVKAEDRGRAQYVKDHFHCDIEDPLLYHVVINTDRITCEDAAKLIGKAARKLFQVCAKQALS